MPPLPYTRHPLPRTLNLLLLDTIVEKWGAITVEKWGAISNNSRFKHKIMCVSQPWICNGGQRSNGSDRGNDDLNDALGGLNLNNELRKRRRLNSYKIRHKFKRYNYKNYNFCQDWHNKLLFGLQNVIWKWGWVPILCKIYLIIELEKKNNIRDRKANNRNPKKKHKPHQKTIPHHPFMKKLFSWLVNSVDLRKLKLC